MEPFDVKDVVVVLEHLAETHDTYKQYSVYLCEGVCDGNEVLFLEVRHTSGGTIRRSGGYPPEMSEWLLSHAGRFLIEETKKFRVLRIC